MNKAFVKEGSDSLELEREEPIEPIPGGRNYLTPAGALKLQEELRTLQSRERPAVLRQIEAAGAAAGTESPEYVSAKKRLREIDRRLRYLALRWEAAEVIDPCQTSAEQVLFGATVLVRTEAGEEQSYSIVGIDESDASKGRISWLSPLAKALLNSRAGDMIEFHSPRGLREFEILEVQYREIG